MNHQHPHAGGYLEATVKTAPPARLRFMLLERAVGLCHSISGRWKSSGSDKGWDEQSIQLADILTELLSGVGQSDLPVAKKVADLYVFLIKHLENAVTSGDVSMVDELRIVLETEAETWRLVCVQTSAEMMQAKDVIALKQHLATAVDSSNGEKLSSLNLQG